jgi:anti-anti-sigma factor
MAQIDVDTGTGVVTGRGDLDLASAGELRAAIAAVLESDAARTVVIDLREVSFIDSTGVKELIRPTIEGFSVRLRHPSEQVQRVLKLSGLDGTVTIEP